MRSSRPTAAEQEEERKVWGSRSCHTQMTDCGGLFSSSFSRNPDALPPPFPLLPPSYCSLHLGQLETTASTTQHPPPPSLRTPEGRRAFSWTTGQIHCRPRGKQRELPVFFSNRAKPQVCLVQKEGAPAARGLGSPKEGPCYGATVSIGAASKGWLPLVAT